MEQNIKKLGNVGEKIAVNFLIKNGYKIISKNTMIKHKEIDIIAEKNNQLRFIEVKTRVKKNKNDKTLAEDYIKKGKIKNIKQAIYNFCLILDKKDDNIHIDLIAININLKEKMANIKHFFDIS